MTLNSSGVAEVCFAALDAYNRVAGSAPVARDAVAEEVMLTSIQWARAHPVEVLLGAEALAEAWGLEVERVSELEAARMDLVLGVIVALCFDDQDRFREED